MNSIATLVVCLLVGISVGPHCWSAEPPHHGHTIQRSGENDLVVVHTKLRFTTLILLPEGEEVSEVTCGDKEYWVVEAKDSNVVHVKPAKEGATTNLNIISKSRAVYSFILEEISAPKTRVSKLKPDLIVQIDPQELSQLRKEKDEMSELLLRTERELREERIRAAEAERKRVQKREELPPAKPQAVLPPVQPPPAAALPPRNSETHPEVSAPQDAAKALVSVVKVERRPSFLSSTEHVVRSFLVKAGRFFRIL